MDRARSPLAVALLVALALLDGGAAAAPRRGVALGLFSEDAGWSYAPLLDEIRELGATHVELVVPLYQTDGTSTVIGYHPRYSPPLDTVRRTIREAHARGLGVLLFPIVRLSAPRSGQWRGTLAPVDPAAWFESYRERLVELATLAGKERVEMMSIGSELSTLDTDAAPWEPLVRAVRARYRGLLVYSGNWDHFEAVAIYRLVDRAGVCAYFPLTTPAVPLPSVDALALAWLEPGARLGALRARVGRPILLTELGYRSQARALPAPWDEGAATPVDEQALEAQRRGFAAFRAAMSPLPAWLDGVFVWNWYGWGGRGSAGYTPRGKPAQVEVERLLRAR